VIDSKVHTLRGAKVRFGGWMSKAALAGMACGILAGCAPEAMSNYQATGFNGYLATLKRSCPNMRIGDNEIGLALAYGGINENYNYWLDMTSRLFYGRISPAAYRDGITGQLGPGSSNAAAFDCIFGNLPAQR
jgi:hypothetical protein